MRNADQPISRDQLGRDVWGMDFDPTSNVVGVYVTALRRKIDDGRSNSLIHTVRDVEYRFGTVV